MIAFYITFIRCNDINIYKRWLGNLNCPEEIFRLENLNLNFFEVQTFWSQVTQKINKITAITLAVRQKEWNAINCDTEIT